MKKVFSWIHFKYLVEFLKKDPKHFFDSKVKILIFINEHKLHHTNVKWIKKFKMFKVYIMYLRVKSFWIYTAVNFFKTFFAFPRVC